MFRPGGARGGPDRFLYAKLASFFLGAGFLVAGMTTGRDWAVAVAIGVLLVGVVLRLLSRRDRGDGEPLPPDDPDSPA